MGINVPVVAPSDVRAPIKNAPSGDMALAIKLIERFQTGRRKSTATLVVVRVWILVGLVALAASCGARTEVSDTRGLDASTDSAWKASDCDVDGLFAPDAMPEMDASTCLALPRPSNGQLHMWRRGLLSSAQHRLARLHRALLIAIGLHVRVHHGDVRHQRLRAVVRLQRSRCTRIVPYVP